MSDVLIAAGIDAAAQLATTGWNNKAAMKREEAARDWNLEQWHRQNEYNSPEQQMARLKEGGLNPNLVYGGGSGGTAGMAGPVPSAKAPPVTSNIRGDNAMRYVQQKVQNDLTEAAVKKTQAEEQLALQKSITEQEKAINTFLNNRRLNRELPYVVPQMEANLMATNSQVALNNVNYLYKSVQLDWLPQQEQARLNQVLGNVNLLEAQTKGVEATTRKTNVERQIAEAAFDLIQKGVPANAPWYIKTMAYADKHGTIKQMLNVLSEKAKDIQDGKFKLKDLYKLLGLSK